MASVDPIEFPTLAVPVNHVHYCPKCGWIAFIEQPPAEHYEPYVPPLRPCPGKPRPAAIVADDSILGKMRKERDRQLAKHSRMTDQGKTIGEWRDLINQRLGMATKSHRRKHLIQAAALILAAIEAFDSEDDDVFEPDPNVLKFNISFQPRPIITNKEMFKAITISFDEAAQSMEKMAKMIEAAESSWTNWDEDIDHVQFPPYHQIKSEQLKEVYREARQGPAHAMRGVGLSKFLRRARRHV